MAHGPAHDPAQHIAAPLIGRQHAVGDQEGGRAQMVGDHPVAGTLVLALRRHRSDRRRPRSAGGTGRCRNCRACPAAAPRSAPAPCRCRSTAAAGRPARPASNCSNCMKTRFQISMNRSPSSSGSPEGRPRCDRHDRRRSPSTGRTGRCRPSPRNCRLVGMRMIRLVRQAGDLAPEIEGLVIGVVDRDQQLLLVDAEFLRQQVPGKLDRALLEIVAEGEVAEHLEEGVVARGVADIVEIVVLAAGAHAFLRRRRRRIGRGARGR
jgi:hypothetical protein